MPRKRDDALIDERRSQLMQAAAVCFARKGYHRTTVREIALEAGLADGTLYLYFQSKKGLLLSFLEERVVAPLLAVLERQDDLTDEERVKAFFQSRFEMARKNGEVMKVIFGEAVFDDDMAAQFAAKVLRPVRTALTRFVRDAVARGSFRDVDPQTTASIMVSTFFGYFLLWHVIVGDSLTPATQETLVNTLSEVLLTGIAA